MTAICPRGNCLRVLSWCCCNLRTACVVTGCPSWVKCISSAPEPCRTICWCDRTTVAIWSNQFCPAAHGAEGTGYTIKDVTPSWSHWAVTVHQHTHSGCSTSLSSPVSSRRLLPFHTTPCCLLFFCYFFVHLFLFIIQDLFIFTSFCLQLPYLLLFHLFLSLALSTTILLLCLMLV